jgi:hypothetical protein
MTMLIKLFGYYPAWSSLMYPLSPFARLFVLLLVLVCAYTVYFASVVLVRLRSIRKRHTLQNDASVRQSLALLNHRSVNLQQIVLGIFYLFGITFFTLIQSAYWTPENHRPVGIMVLENFSVYFRFAAVIFLVFLVLHSVQWFVSGRIRTAALRLDTQVTE